MSVDKTAPAVCEAQGNPVPEVDKGQNALLKRLLKLINSPDDHTLMNLRTVDRNDVRRELPRR